MKLVFVLFFSLFASGMAHADEPTVRYKDLLGIQETIDISSIEVKGIVDGSHDIANFNPTTIKLHIKGVSACGKDFFVDFRHGAIKFFQVGSLAPHIQPACFETIEYFWTPRDYELSNGETKVLTQKIGPEVEWTKDERKESYFTVFAKVTKKAGQFPDGNGVGTYFVYSDVKVEGPQR